jgi:hypothetical protein
MKLLILVLLFFSVVSLPNENEMKFIRKTFYQAVEDKTALVKLEDYITKRYSRDSSMYTPVILAYSGGIEALKAKYVFSPFSKFSHLIKSLDILDEAVSRMPDNLEVRFIRFSILDNIPGIFGYGKEKASDKEVIISELLRKDFGTIDKETQIGLIKYLLESSNINEEEKSILLYHNPDILSE